MVGWYGVLVFKSLMCVVWWVGELISVVAFEVLK